jgi:sugar O-acyltransferase (sialic acid O-acetyltransferase NeuD family)
VERLSLADESLRTALVIGAGGHAKVVMAALRDAGYSIAAILDDDPDKWGKDYFGAPVVGGSERLKEMPYDAVIAVGDNNARREISERCPGCRWLTAVHPAAYVHDSVRLGRGSVIMAGCVIQPDSRIGGHVIVNTGASVDHDCEIGDFVHIAPGARLAGGVSVGEGALIGINSVVLPGKRIGAWAVVGAGSVVIDDVPPYATVAGVPARPLGKE